MIQAIFSFMNKTRLGRRGSVALLFAISLLPIVIVVSVAVDMSRMTDGRAALQRAVDNAALSGAAAYAVNSSAYNSLAITIATSAFCNAAQSLPASFALVSAGTVNGTAAESCNNIAVGQAGANAGPSVSAVIAGYKPGTPGVAAGAGCTATNAVVPPYECGFVVTVNATATFNSLVPSLFGATNTISVTGVSLNPFINIASAISTKINGSASNTNSVWLYPLLLTTSGQPDFTTNPGALPNVSGTSFPPDAASSLCTDDPSQTSCGPYTMLADTAFNNVGNPKCPVPANGCYPFGAGGAYFINGVVQTPTAPTAVITATTPIGIAFESIGGGNDSYGYPGGYQVNPTTNGCLYPGNGVYGTVIQVYNNGTSGGNSLYGPVAATSTGLPWPKVTHWFYSSYLLNNLPPSEGEIMSQTTNLSSYYNATTKTTKTYNLDVQSIGNNTTNSFLPALINCDPNIALQNPTPTDADELLTTSYFTTGLDNVNLFILKQPVNSTYIPPIATTYNGVALTKPAGAVGMFYPQDAGTTAGGTPGAQYAGLSCQSYGTNQFTFYWNDAGGSQGFGDDRDYNNGSVVVACNGPAFVVLIQ